MLISKKPSAPNANLNRPNANPLDLTRTPMDPTNPPMRLGEIQFTMGTFAFGLHWASGFHVVCLVLVYSWYPTRTQFLVEYGLYISPLYLQKVYLFISFWSKGMRTRSARFISCTNKEIVLILSCLIKTVF